MGQYAQTIYGNSDVKLMVYMFPNFVGQTGYVGNFANDPSQIMYPTPPTISAGNNTRFGYRQPVRTDGTTGYWFMQGTGDASTEQAIVDEHINMLADCGVYGVILLYYPQSEHVTSAPTGAAPLNPWSKCLWQWARYYLTSPYKSRLKFAIAAISGHASYDVNTGAASSEFSVAGTYLNLPNFAAYWATLMQDSQYLKDSSGLPFFYLYDALDSWTTTTRDIITTAATNVGFSGVHYVQANQDDAQASALNADRGGYNNGIGVGTQNSFATQITKDRSYWDKGASLRNKNVAVSLFNDGRVARDVSTWWTDHPTYTQAETSLRQAFGFARASRKVPDQIVTCYPGGELAEGGEFYMTRQTRARGVNTTTYGIMLDAIKNVTSRNYPSTYIDCYHAMDAHADIVRTGGAHWTTANFVSNGGGSAQGAYKFQEHRNSTAADTIKITPAVSCTRIRVYGRKGPGFGVFGAQTDGGGSTSVDQSAVSDSYNQLLYDTGVLGAGSHNVLITVTSGTISLDEFKVNVSRTPPTT